jgi:cell wall-associated NlpC family hydrolase
MDAIVPGFGVRVTGAGQRTFMLRARFPGSRNANRRAIADCGAITLEEARARARDWIELVRKGIDPQAEEDRKRRAEIHQQQNTFAAVAEDFIRNKLPSERKGAEVAGDIRREFIPAWGRRPVTEITRRDIRDLIEAKKETAPAQARNLLGTIKRLLSWGVDRDCYGLSASPADTLKPGKIVGDKKTGDRIPQ